MSSANMCRILAFAALLKCFASTTTGEVVIESIPRRPQKTDHVTLRCYAIPAKLLLLQRRCHFEWEWKPKERNNQDHEKDGLKTLLPDSVPWSKIVNQNVVEFGSVAVIDEFRNEHQGRFTCLLSCEGRALQTAFVVLDFKKNDDNRLYGLHSRIAYITTGVLFGVIVFVTVLRFACLNASECCCASQSAATSINAFSIDSHSPQLNWLENHDHRSVNTIHYKPKLERRPTILSRNVWLPPYDAALKHTRLLSSVSSSSSAGSQPEAASAPPTYEEALCLLRQPVGLGGNGERIQVA